MSNSGQKHAQQMASGAAPILDDAALDAVHGGMEKNEADGHAESFVAAMLERYNLKPGTNAASVIQGLSKILQNFQLDEIKK